MIGWILAFIFVALLFVGGFLAYHFGLKLVNEAKTPPVPIPTSLLPSDEVQKDVSEGEPKEFF